jgi:hypothetical protein
MLPNLPLSLKNDKKKKKYILCGEKERKKKQGQTYST